MHFDFECNNCYAKSLSISVVLIIKRRCELVFQYYCQNSKNGSYEITITCQTNSVFPCLGGKNNRFLFEDRISDNVARERFSNKIKLHNLFYFEGKTIDA